MQSIASFQLIQGKLADMYARLQACRAFVHRAANEADMGRADRKDCAAVILYCAETATQTALDAIQVCTHTYTHTHTHTHTNTLAGRRSRGICVDNTAQAHARALSRVSCEYGCILHDHLCSIQAHSTVDISFSERQSLATVIGVALVLFAGARRQRICERVPDRSFTA